MSLYKWIKVEMKANNQNLKPGIDHFVKRLGLFTSANSIAPVDVFEASDGLALCAAACVTVKLPTSAALTPA